MPDNPRALLFDVQGTATDFHSTIVRAIDGADGAVGVDGVVGVAAGDRSEFVNRWRAAYFDRVADAAPSAERWTSVHSIYRAALDDLVGAGVADDVRERLTFAWQQLDPWPDTVEGLTRLRQRHTIATLSNADVSAVINISRHGRLPWDAIFTAEMARAFKPDPAAYRMAAAYLGFAPAEIMMVASHKYDIRAAKALGFRTAFVARPFEFGDPALADVEYSAEFEINASDFVDLADQLS